MSEVLNKASICSVVFLGIADQSEKPVFRQIKDKELFHRLIDEATSDVAQHDRIRVDTNDGMVMALAGSPEEALFVAMTIRDAIVKHNKISPDDALFVRTGISMGPVKTSSDIGGLLRIQGGGVDAAEHVMNLARPNQILVSRAYYEITSGLTDEIAGMYSRFGSEQEVYAVRSPEEEPFVPESVAEPAAAVSLFSRMLNNENSSRYGLWGSAVLVGIVVLVGGFMLFSNLLRPDLGVVIADSKPKPTVRNAQPVSTPRIAAPAATPITHETAPTLEQVDQEPVAEAAATSLPAKPRAKPARPVAKLPHALPPVDSPVTTEAQIDVPQSEAPGGYEPKPEERVITHVEKKVATAPAVKRGPVVEERELPSRPRPKTVWDNFRESFKQGRKEHVCTQAEIALNQCK